MSLSQTSLRRSAAGSQRRSAPAPPAQQPIRARPSHRCTPTCGSSASSSAAVMSLMEGSSFAARITRVPVRSSSRANGSMPAGGFSRGGWRSGADGLAGKAGGMWLRGGWCGRRHRQQMMDASVDKAERPAQPFLPAVPGPCARPTRPARTQDDVAAGVVHKQDRLGVPAAAAGEGWGAAGQQGTSGTHGSPALQ